MYKVILTVLAIVFLASGEAEAQLEQQIRNQQYGAQNLLNRFSTRNSILSNPNVSPYLALTDFNGGGANPQAYFTQVRPALQAREQQMNQQRNLESVQRSLAQLNSAVSNAQQAGYRGTGHPTRFMTYLHYYQGLNR